MRARLSTYLILCFGLLAARGALAAPLERVPEDGSLQQAIQRVSDHGTISIAAGTYAAPANGFRIRNKSVTLSARGGAVVLDGLGASTIFRVESRGAGGGDTVAFEGITFRNGSTTDNARAGAVTVDAASATFAGCVFDSNAAAGGSTRGGAIQARGGSSVRVVASRFVDNTAGMWGAGIFAIEQSTVRVLWSEFTGNRTDLPDQGPTPAGAAIYVFDAEAHIVGSHFEGNRSGWVGGALYALGSFQNPPGVPSALLTVEGSTFVGNRALPGSCCTVPGPSVGGAIHVENQAKVIVRDSRFLENSANWGGAISSFRAGVEVHDSVFRGNRAMAFRGVLGAGGTFNLASAEVPEPDNGFGAINRPPASLLVTDSLIQGRFGATGVAAQQGGCILALGDGNAFLGLGGMPQLGTAEDNRIPVVLDRVVLSDCDVETGPEGNGLGGALMVNLADVSLTGSIVIDSDSLGDPAAGGGILSLGDTVLRVTDTALARNVAESSGGAIEMSGGQIEIRDSLFLENDVSPDVAPGPDGEEPVHRAPGAVLHLRPTSDMDITGVVESSVFTANVGMPIVDVDNDGGPTFNRVVYNGNEIQSTAFGSQVYKDLAVTFAGLTVDDLNGLVIDRSDGSTTVKSEVDNVFLSSRPRDGRLVAAPSRLSSSGTPVDPGPTSGFLGYAWSGTSSSVNGVSLADKTGLEEIDAAGVYRQRINAQAFTDVTVGAEGCSRGGVLCLNGERFLVEVDFRDFNDNLGAASVVPGGSDDSGLYFFFNEDNWEMLVKVLDGCGITDHFWLFAAATTNVEYTLRLTDKLTGATKSYFNPLGNAAAAITDTEALAVCDAKAASPLRPAPVPRIAPLPAAPVAPVAPVDLAKQTSCADTDTELCLNRSRFRLEVRWRDFADKTGSAEVVPLRSDDSGLFFFFNEDNWEMLVKVLDGCSITDHYWVFSAATTNVEYTLTVTDTETGALQTYFNPLGNAAAAVTDTGAFATCP